MKRPGYWFLRDMAATQAAQTPSSIACRKRDDAARNTARAAMKARFPDFPRSGDVEVALEYFETERRRLLEES